ncbi:MAG: transporter substrate-binding domain-containing protein [Deltaproteobacteria bacterium]|nr:transporter substrate-binding domain-containing protein [Deltaproteobacteria bacterium]
MKVKYLLYVLCSFFINSVVLAKIPKGTTIRICGDGAEWPPYHFFKRSGDKVTKNVIGYSIDVIDTILKHEGLKTDYSLPPWARCLKDTKAGSYQIALDSSFNAERDKIYLYTDSHYIIHPALFYDTNTFPKGVNPQNSLADVLKIGNVCGLHGYNYEGMSDEIKNEMINQEAKTYGSLVKMVKSSRCKFMIARKEAFRGFREIGQDFFKDNRLRETPLPNGAEDPFHLLISKKYPHADALRTMINQGLKRIRKTGEIKKIHKKWLPDA